MNLQDCIAAATKEAKKNKIVMVVVNDPIANNVEDEPEGPYGYCPACAVRPDGKLILYPWGVIERTINP